ncbi:hypothetical protein D3C75_951310 [compost metagenome]
MSPQSAIGDFTQCFVVAVETTTVTIFVHYFTLNGCIQFFGVKTSGYDLLADLNGWSYLKVTIHVFCRGTELAHIAFVDRNNHFQTVWLRCVLLCQLIDVWFTVIVLESQERGFHAMEIRADLERGCIRQRTLGTETETTNLVIIASFCRTEICSVHSHHVFWR